jgi:fructose-bisphosphate aldolase class II
MPLVSLRQLLDHAAENQYGLPAFNVNNLEQVSAIMAAADEVGAPVIMQASAGARKYAGEAFLRHLISAAVESYPHIPVVMHQDHGQSPAVCMAAIRSGFSSVMMDSISKVLVRPNPLQAVHAPRGELNENKRGSRSG